MKNLPASTVLELQWNPNAQHDFFARYKVKSFKFLKNGSELNLLAFFEKYEDLVTAKEYAAIFDDKSYQWSPVSVQAFQRHSRGGSEGPKSSSSPPKSKTTKKKSTTKKNSGSKTQASKGGNTNKLELAKVLLSLLLD